MLRHFYTLRTALPQFSPRGLNTIFLIAVLMAFLLFPNALWAQTFKRILDFRTGPTVCCSSGSSTLVQGRDGNMYGIVVAQAPFSIGGSFYRLTPSGAIQVLHNFDTIEIQRVGQPVLGDDGDFYAVAADGGTYQYGVFFKMTPSGTPTILYSFGAGNTGVWPYGLIKGQDGNFYGASVIQPGNGYIIFKATPAGVVTPLYTFDINHGPRSLVQGRDGNLYGTAGQGSQNGSVFKLTTAGKMNILYNFDGVHGANAGMLLQGSGPNFFGTTVAGGATGDGVAFMITPSGVLTVVHTFDRDDPANGYLATDLFLANDGNFYGVTAYGGKFGYGVIFRMNTKGAFTVLYDFDKNHGSSPVALMQHTNGKMYGTTSTGGTYSRGGLYQFDMGLNSFVMLQPTSGVVGDAVGILGHNFLNALDVHFYKTIAAFNVQQDGFLTTTVPDGVATGYVQVLTLAGSAKSSTMFKVLPKVVSFSPLSGTIGSQVIIAGTTFTGATKVVFGNVKATFTVDSDSQITATVPVGAVTSKIWITTPSGTGASPTRFTVVP
jgi:uncharacterized repeat protein (TIGR03803 family)